MTSLKSIRKLLPVGATRSATLGIKDEALLRILIKDKSTGEEYKLAFNVLIHDHIQLKRPDLDHIFQRDERRREVEGSKEIADSSSGALLMLAHMLTDSINRGSRGIWGHAYVTCTEGVRSEERRKVSRLVVFKRWLWAQS